MRILKFIFLLLTLMTVTAAQAQYNPENPPEPNVPATTYTLTLKVSPSGAGSVSGSRKVAAGTRVNISTSAKTGYKFLRWVNADGETLSTNTGTSVVMPAEDMTLTALYLYSPDNPVEPSKPDVKEQANVKLSINPPGAGNVSGGGKYVVGTKASIVANAKSGYSFQNWTRDGEVVSTSSSFNYTVEAEGASFVANFKYSPSDPSEPNTPVLSYPLTLKTDPSGAGYFNISSGTRYAAGRLINLNAYANTGYVFHNITDASGAVVSQTNEYLFNMPASATELTAHYKYSPSNPSEPSQTAPRRNVAYGSRQTVMPGHTVMYAVNLENVDQITDITLYLNIPSGYEADFDNATLGSRAEGRSLSVSPGDVEGAWVITIQGTEPFAGGNGPIVTVPVKVPAYAESGSSAIVPLTKAIGHLSGGTSAQFATSDGILKTAETEITLPDSPDFVVTDVTADAAQLMPGDNVTVRWSVSNSGNIDATGGWKETVSLVDGNGVRAPLGTLFYETDRLGTDGSVSRSGTFVIPDLPGVDGPLNVMVSLNPYASSGEIEEYQGNNSGISENSPVTLGKVLMLTLPASMTEGQDLTARCRLDRSGSRSKSETFRLEKIGDSRLSMPASVTIAKNQSGTYFTVKIDDNNILDASDRFSIAVSGNQYDKVDKEMTVVDNELPELSLIGAPEEMIEGDSFTMKLVSARACPETTEFDITCDRPLRFSYPKRVIIEAGKTETEIKVTAVDNSDVELAEAVCFSASAAGYKSDETYLTLIDDDLPDITMALTPTVVSEDAGGSAVVATVSRSDDSDTDTRVTVRISDDSNGGIYFNSRQLTLESGVKSVSFNIGVTDNGNVDGDREYTITASVYSSKCNCSALGQSRGSVSRKLKVTDNDGPKLTLTSVSSALVEGTANNRFTLTRNAGLEGPLTVSLSTDTPGRITLPATVTFANGEKSISFNAEVTDDSSSSSDVIVSVIAEAEGFSAGSCWVQITDTTLPDVAVSAITSDKSACFPGDRINVTATVKNTGNAPLQEKIPVSIYMTGSSEKYTAYTESVLSPGASEEVVKTITLPEAVGSYGIYAVANENGNIRELNKMNNTSTRIEVTVSGDITAALATDKAVYNPGETIKFSGKASGAIAAGKNVEIYVINAGLRQTVTAKMDASGNFSGEWTPMARQLGRVVAGACYPGDKATDTMATFDILGLSMDKPFDSVETMLGENTSGKMKVSNPSGVAITGLKLSERAGGRVSMTLPDRIEPQSEVWLEYSIDATQPSEGTDWEKMKVTLTSNETKPLDFTLYTYVHTPKARLELEQASINTTMTKGKSRDIPVRLRNTGKGDTGKVTVTPTGCAWLGLASPMTIAGIPSGEYTDIVLRLTPTADMALNTAVRAGVAFNCENGDGVALSLRVVPVSDETGTFVFDACDEYTYNTPEAPHLAGATVTVMDYADRKVVATGTTGADGLWSVVLPEGNYYATVTEPRHSSWSGTIMVDPGTESRQRCNLSVRGMEVNFKWEPTEIGDEYELITDVKYETNVPVPVIETILPDRLDIDAIEPGKALLFNAVMTNKGLITGKNTQLIIPEVPEGFEISFPGENGFDLPAGVTKVIPVKITRLAGQQNAPARAARASNARCTLLTLEYTEWVCGSDKQWHEVEHRIPIRVCMAPDLGPGGSGGGWGGGGLGLGGWSSPGGPSPNPGSTHKDVKKPQNEEPQEVDHQENNICSPCVQHYAKKASSCMDFDPDHPLQSLIKKIPIVGDLFGCGFDIHNNLKDGADALDWTLTAGGCAAAVCEAIGAVLVGTGVAAGAGGAMIAYCKPLGELAGKGGCIKGLLEPCKPPEFNGPKAGNANRRTRAASSGYPSYIEQLQDKLRPISESFDAINEFLEAMVGDEVYLSTDRDQINEFFGALALIPKGVEYDVETLATYKPDNVTDAQFAALVERMDKIRRSQDGDRVEGFEEEWSNLCAIYRRIGTAATYAKENGYASVKEMFIDAFTQYAEGLEEERSSICSSLTLKISQRMTMTRQTVRATLDVTNGHESETMTDFKIGFTVYDNEGNIAGSDRMQIAPESLAGFEGENTLDSGWSLAPDSDGKATILLIPTRLAAPEVPLDYTFTANISYTDPFTGLTVTEELNPATLTVNPSPVIDMTYLMQRDIYGDDPLTPDVVEKSVPAEFALILTNKGKGDATNVRMTTNQPTITENEKGLSVNFDIVSSQVAGADAVLTFGKQAVNDFGTIKAGTSTYAQWWLRSSLLGHFDDYNVTATHLTSYGNENLSLLDVVEIKELIHGFTPVRTLDAQSGDESPANVRAFLTNEIKDLNDTPDFVRFSDGSEGRNVGTSTSYVSQVGENVYDLHVTAAEAGWVYGNIADPTDGTAVLKEASKNGVIIPLDNFWQTDRTLRDKKEPKYENRLHYVAEAADQSEMTFHLTFEPRPDLELAVIGFSGIPAAGEITAEPVTKVSVSFNKDVDATTFTAEDVTLSCQGVTVNSENVTVTPVSAREFELGFGDLTAVDGYYTLIVQAGDINDTQGYAGAGGKSVGWIQLADGTCTVTVTPEPAEGGSVAPALSKVEAGDRIQLKAVAAEGYSFVGWQLGDEILGYDSEMDYVADKSVEIKGAFKPVPHSVTVECNSEEGKVENGGTGIYDHGAELNLEAVPADGYDFVGWTIDDKDVSSESVLNVIVKSDMVIRAIFAARAEGSVSTVDYTFGEGWNWASFGMFAGRGFQDVISPARLMFRELRGASDLLTFDGREWNGDITLSHLDGYKLKFDGEASLSAVGHVPGTGDMTVTLQPGLNRMGYPLTAARPVAEALSGLSAEEGDAVIGRDAFAIFNGSDWVGPLTELNPGAMYEVKVNSLMSFSWDAVDASDVKADLRPKLPVAPAQDWNVNPAPWPANMGIVAELKVTDTEITPGRFIIGVFDNNGKCRGMSKESDGRFFITVYGDTEDMTPLRYRVYDAQTSNVLEVPDRNFSFAEDVKGTISNPVIVDCLVESGIDSLNADVRVWPVPATDRLYVSGLDDMDAELTLINTNGVMSQKMRGYSEGSYLDVSKLESGYYLLIIDSKQTGTISRKVIIER